MATIEEVEIEDFLEGSFVKTFENGETRVYQFDVAQCKVVSKNGFDGKLMKVLRYVVRIQSLWSNPGNSWTFQERTLMYTTN